MNQPRDFETDPLAALRAGDSGPLEAFVVQESATLVAFFARRGADWALAEDLTQEVFAKLIVRSHHYQPQGSFMAFVLAVARNAWIDHCRRASVRPQAEGEVSADVESRNSAPGASLEQGEQAGRVRRALEALDQAHAVVFELAVIQQRPYAEIARDLCIPEGTVKSRVFHAVRKLRAVLAAPAAPRRAKS